MLLGITCLNKGLIDKNKGLMIIPLRFIIISLAFFYLSKLLFLGLLLFKGSFVHGQNNWKCDDSAPLTNMKWVLEKNIYIII